MIWLTGARGMLGTDVCARLTQLGFQVRGTDLEVDIRDAHSVTEFTRELRPRWIINCAAYTAVDRAEDEPELARQLNADSVAHLARVAVSVGARLIHISTDYVFDGSKATPYTEDDPVCPASVYGHTKAAGEQALWAAAERAFVIRTAWLYGKHGKNFVGTMLRLFEERETVSVVSDQYGSPTWAKDLSGCIGAIVSQDSDAYGTYHFTGAGETTWYEFASEIYQKAIGLRLLESECLIKPIATVEYTTKAARPPYSVLSTDKARATFAIDVPHWKDSLWRYLAELAKDSIDLKDNA